MIIKKCMKFSVSVFIIAFAITGASGSVTNKILHNKIRFSFLTHFGDKVLLIKDIEEIQNSPKKPGFINILLGAKNEPDLPSIIRFIRSAAHDDSVRILALENLPSLGGYASSQEFAQALGVFRKAGKKVYIYSDNFTSPGQFLQLASQADFISLNPTGVIYLVSPYSDNLYFKNFLDLLGLRFVNATPWATKSAFNPFSYSEMPPEEKAMLERILGDILQQDLKALSGDSRKKKLTESPASLIAEGPYLEADKALSAGLVDSVEYPDEFEARFSGRIVETFSPSRSMRIHPFFARKAALLYLNGNIITGKGSAGKNIGYLAAEEIKRIRKDPMIKALLLRIDSGGGVVSTSDLIAKEVRETVACGKPVVVSMGNLAASGGYYISAYASRIFAEPGTLTGSIGVTIGTFYFSGTLQKLGIHTGFVGTSDSSGFMDPAEEPRENDINKLRSSLLAYYNRFVRVVADGRSMDPDRVYKLGEGQIWTGREAFTNGLVDSIGGLEDAKSYLTRLLGAPLNFTEIIPGESGLSGGILENLVLSSLSKETGIPPELFNAFRDHITDRVRFGRGPLYYFDSSEIND